MRASAITLICPQCGKPFQTTASRKEYCSIECLRKHDNEAKHRLSITRNAISSKLAEKEALSDKALLSISEAAKFLGVSRPTIYTYIKEGKLTPIRKSSAIIRIPVEQLTSTEQKTEQLPSLDVTAYLTKKEILKKYKISETWFHRRIKEKGVKSVRIGARSYYEAVAAHHIFHKEDKFDTTGWYTSDELALREGITKKHLCTIARRLGIKTQRGNTTTYIDREGWDSRKLAPTVIEKNYMTVDQAKQHYHIGGKTFYDAINATTIEKVKKGNYVYFPIKDLDRLFKNREPDIPAEIRRDYITAKAALSYCHVGQKRFSADTKAAGVTKIRTEGNFVWYKKSELDKLFKL